MVANRAFALVVLPPVVFYGQFKLAMQCHSCSRSLMLNGVKNDTYQCNHELWNSVSNCSNQTLHRTKKFQKKENDLDSSINVRVCKRPPAIYLFVTKFANRKSASLTKERYG